MKKVVKINFCVLFLTMVLFLMGCSNTKINNILDIERYEDLSTEVSEIAVSYDIGEASPFEFKISNEEEISEIMDIILNTNLIKTNSSSDGGHTNITLITNKKEYNILISQIKEKGNYYCFENDNLYNKISDLKVIYE